MIKALALNFAKNAMSPDSYVRSRVHGFETLQERMWEVGAYLFPGTVSDGEMTAIVRRNGYAGFHQYAVAQMLGQFGRRNFIPGDREGVARRIKEEFPERAKNIIEIADRILTGEFNLLGSGPVDMRRGILGSHLDWTRDPITGERYQKIFSNLRWNPFKMRRGNADVKGPWELTRSQHFPILGQAYWLTGDERYAQCFADTIIDFIRKNPKGLGVHWACTMDVGLRVVSWLIGLSFFQGSSALTFRWWRRVLKSLVEHGRFITAHLEFGTLDGKIIVSNHGLADFFGLYWLAVNFPGLDAGCVWRGISEAALEQQVRIQILSDGGPFESSLPYHRLVTEMLLSAYALSQHHRIGFSEGYRSQLLKALSFLRSLRQPGGRIAQIGDADNGRGHIFSGYGFWEKDQENIDHLLAAGAVVLNCPNIFDGLSHDSTFEGLFWRDRHDPEPRMSELAPAKQLNCYQEAGIAALRAGNSHVTFCNSVCGTLGIGNHKHNDQLSVEWSAGEHAIIVDPGSYTYTQDPDSRNLFRGTAIHNTVMVDKAEQNGLDPSALFRMIQQGRPEWIKQHQSEDGSVGVWASHSGYKNIEPSVIHQRRLIVRYDGTVVIEDLFDNPFEHSLRWNFTLHPRVSAEISDNRVILHHSGDSIVDSGDVLSWRIEQTWYSSGYGVRVPTVALVAELDNAPKHIITVLSPNAESNLSVTDAHQYADMFWHSMAITEKS